MAASLLELSTSTSESLESVSLASDAVAAAEELGGGGLSSSGLSSGLAGTSSTLGWPTAIPRSEAPTGIIVVGGDVSSASSENWIESSFADVE